MQRIVHDKDYKSVHWLFDAIENFYYEVSGEEYDNGSLIPHQYDYSFKSLMEAFIQYGNFHFPDNLLTDKHIKPLELPWRESTKNNVLLCFSGGKDSIAVAKSYIDNGCNVVLFYVTHINSSLSDEVEVAHEAANLLGARLVLADIRKSGYCSWMEHPMKNMIIANMALQWAIQNKFTTRIAFGNYNTSVLEDNPFDRCAGDCMDMWFAYNDIIRNLIPNFSIEARLENMTETLSIVAPNKELLEVSLSCLCRHSLRPYRHDWVLTKFGVNLPKRRCGSCYKCCVEYIYMVDHDLTDFNADYYKYCINQLRRILHDEEYPVWSIYDVWEYFFAYPIDQSKMFTTLTNTRMMIRSIKWLNR